MQVYGLLSAGIGYTSDEGGHALTHAISGSNQNPRIGFRGQEDLGDGLKALFVLENGFNVMTGTSAQSGRLLGRIAQAVAGGATVMGIRIAAK